jgi:hypothetical protein
MDFPLVRVILLDEGLDPIEFQLRVIERGGQVVKKCAPSKADQFGRMQAQFEQFKAGRIDLRHLARCIEHHHATGQVAQHILHLCGDGMGVRGDHVPVFGLWNSLSSK